MKKKIAPIIFWTIISTIMAIMAWVSVFTIPPLIHIDLFFLLFIMAPGLFGLAFIVNIVLTVLFIKDLICENPIEKIRLITIFILITGSILGIIDALRV